MAKKLKVRPSEKVFIFNDKSGLLSEHIRAAGFSFLANFDEMEINMV
jgi:hypothetical protein